MIENENAGDERDDGLQMRDADDHDGVPLGLAAMKRRDGGRPFRLVTRDAPNMRLKRSLAFDLGEIRHRAGGLADLVEQLQPVLAQAPCRRH